jgi:hypothetical protein
LEVITNKIVASHHPALAGRLVDGSAAAKCRMGVVNTTATDENSSRRWRSRNTYVWLGT